MPELLTEPQGITGLAKDLALPDRPSSRGQLDMEQVRNSALVVVNIEVVGDPRKSGRSARSASKRETSSTLPWKRSTSAYTSTRLQVEITVASPT